jgi:hypothetical protein
MKAKIIKSLLLTPGLNNRMGIPAVYRGKPGVGKSSVITQVVNDLGMHCEIVLASVREPSDFLGLPIPSKGGKGVEYAPPQWARRAAEAGDAVVFFDEINTAPPSVQAALLRVILEGAVGDFQLPPGVRFIAAMNSVEDAAGGWDMAPPLANRLAHLDWKLPELQAWVTHLTSAGSQRTQGSDLGRESARIQAGWNVAYAQALGEIAGFLQHSPQNLHAQPARNLPACSGAWPSHRSWEMAARTIAGARLNGLDNTEVEEVTAGCVGIKVAADLGTWREEASVPSANDLLDGKAKFEASAKRPDRAAAVVAGCGALLSPVQDKASQEHTTRVERFVHILVDVARAAPDVASTGAKHLIDAPRVNTRAKHVEEFLRKIAPLAQVS